MDARLDLMEFNTRIPQAEKNRDIAYLDKILDDSLMFKRADGSIADKTTYLDSIRDQQNIVESIDQMITSLEFSKSGDVAIVNSIVMFHGVRSGKDVQGIFRNIRYFRNVGGWRMFVWHNDKLSSSLHCLTLHDNGNDFVLNDKNEMNGAVYQEKSVNGPGAPDPRALHVRFDDGGHTKWHYHEGWQVLIGETGSGFVEEMNEQAMDLSKGKRVFIPPFVWHRHGAKPGETMSHLAVTQGFTTWDIENKFDKDRSVAVPAF